MSEVMRKLRSIEQQILTTGKVDAPELNMLRLALYGRGTIGRPEADFLVELHEKGVQHLAPAFEQFFYRAIKHHLLAHDRIGGEETAWLRRMLFADGTIDDEERKFVHELKREASRIGGEFEVLFVEIMRRPSGQPNYG